MSPDELPSTSDSVMLERLIVPVLRYRWIVIGAAILGLAAAALALFARTEGAGPEGIASVQLLMPHGDFRAVAVHDIESDLALLRSGAVDQRAEEIFGSSLETAADRVPGVNVLALTVRTADRRGAGAGAQAVLDAFTAVRHDVLRDVIESQRDHVVNRLRSLPPRDGEGVVAPGGSDTAPTLVIGTELGGDGLELSYRRAVLGERLDEIEVALNSLDGTDPIAITDPSADDEIQSSSAPVAPVLAIGALGGLAAGVFLAWGIPYLVAARSILRRINQEDAERGRRR